MRKVFKDYDKYLSTSLKVYILVLVIVFIMKIVGLDYFGLSVDSPISVCLNKITEINWLGDIINYITLYIQFYFYLGIVCNKNKLYKWAFIGTSVNFIVQLILFEYYKLDWIYQIISIIITLFIPMIINKKIQFKEQLKCIVIINVYQILSMFIRNVGVNQNYDSFLIDFLLNLDQLLMLAITYEINKRKGELIKCIQEQEVGSFSQKLTNLRKLPKQLQRNWHKFKQLTKVDKITFIIYFILTAIWNLLTIVAVILVAMLNDTVIECIFIITSFWLSKRAFGKAFHLKSMIQCFVVSNITYYILNRITTPLGISILIPIMLGVGLSYVTSKLVKKTYKPLYRGMTKELFEETILQIVDKDSLKYKICYDFYINKKSDLSLSMKYNYSVMGIRKIKSRINDKIKEL